MSLLQCGLCLPFWVFHHRVRDLSLLSRGQPVPPARGGEVPTGPPGKLPGLLLKCTQHHLENGFKKAPLSGWVWGGGCTSNRLLGDANTAGCRPARSEMGRTEMRAPQGSPGPHTCPGPPASTPAISPAALPRTKARSAPRPLAPALPALRSCSTLGPGQPG